MTLGHRLIKKTSPDYPVGLGDLEDPPSLFVDGTLGEMPGVAVVGTRRCTRYGIDLAEAFGVAIARSGWTTVSGLARGIDAAAHRGCLRDGGHAVAVLGSGIDVCYPKENRPILDARLPALLFDATLPDDATRIDLLEVEKIRPSN